MASKSLNRSGGWARVTNRGESLAHFFALCLRTGPCTATDSRMLYLRLMLACPFTALADSERPKTVPQQEPEVQQC